MPVITRSTASASLWILETAHSAYALGLNAAGMLCNAYWGPRLPYVEDYPDAPAASEWASFNGPGQLAPLEYPAYAGAAYVEPCLKVTQPDGVRDTVLMFSGAEADGDTLRVTLRDSHYPLTVTLIYTVHVAYDLIERHAEIHNGGSEAVTIERALSAAWQLPRGTDYHLRHLNGKWLDEWHLEREPLPTGVKRLESRRLTTSHHHSPWFSIDRDATETHGEVWFGALAWSGNWALLAEVTQFQSARVLMGVNDWDFAWRLDAGATFRTPPTVAGYTSGGYQAASHHLHAYIREQVVPHPGAVRRVLYNSWEATMFDFDAAAQMRLADTAARMGVELFVMDDGWFKGRYSDNAGLGDWTPDPQRFPEGLAPLIAHVNALGMDFGLWVEPEMVNPDSDLYRAHPEWVIHFPTRARTEMRNQLILNLARADVQDYLIDVLDRLLRDHNITFIKWDMNRNVSEPGWPDAPGDPRELWVRYVEGLYRVWGTLRERFPHVIWQSCSGGGGRADLGILRHADQIWVSDNTLALSRLGIQEGFSQMFPASVMEAWVTDGDWPPGSARMPVSLRFRFHVSMCGSLGVGLNLLHLSDAEIAESAGYIADYKALRHVIHGGDQYRIGSPQHDAISAVQYMARDGSEGVLFAFRTLIPEPVDAPVIRLRGMIPDARYQIEGIEGVKSGAAWMQTGIVLPLLNLDSTMRRITRV